MLFKANQSVISEAVKTAISVIPARAVLPYTSMFKLVVEDGVLVISASNMETSIKINSPAEVIMKGEICVDAKNFTKLCTSLSNGEITFDYDNNGKLKIKSKKQYFEISACSSDDFVENSYEYKESFSIDCDEFMKLINTPAYACSNDISREVLNGVLVETTENNGIRCVATDGRRLAVTDTGQDISISTLNQCQVIILQKHIDIIKKAFAKQANKIVHFGETGDRFIIETDDLIMTGKKIAGKYPNYRQVIPAGYEYSLGINKDEILNALSLSYICNQNTVGFAFNKDGQIHAQAVSSDFGRSDIPIEYQSSCDIDKEMVIFMDTTFAKEAINSLHEDNITMKFTDKASPVAFVNNNTNNTIAILMPKRE